VAPAAEHFDAVSWDPGSEDRSPPTAWPRPATACAWHAPRGALLLNNRAGFYAEDAGQPEFVSWMLQLLDAPRSARELALIVDELAR